ncbi:MAG: hypothetical protein QOI57_3066, partial [Rubrobacteraceae bacterium]|nr:hypothetical protein [Rubrobacteraceae bacterium]
MPNTVGIGYVRFCLMTIRGSLEVPVVV